MKTTRKNVYDMTQDRLEKIFSGFDNVYVSFSGGKDSGVLLNLCIDYIRKHKLDRKLTVFHMDYEVQYQETIEYVERVFKSNADILDVYRVCVPFKVITCTSMYQQFWRPWDDTMHIRSMIGRQRMYGLQTENSNGTITISMIFITKPASLWRNNV